MKLSFLSVLVFLICAHADTIEDTDPQKIIPETTTSSASSAGIFSKFPDITSWMGGKTPKKTPHDSSMKTIEESSLTTNSPPSGGTYDWLTEQIQHWKKNKSSIKDSDYIRTEIIKIMKQTENPNAEDIPISVFEIPPEFLKSITGATWHHTQNLALSSSNLVSFLSTCISSSVGYVASPIKSAANTITRGESENFPELQLQYMYELFDAKNIRDRQSFSKLPVPKRSFPFQTYVPRLLQTENTGYNGQFIMVDFAFGNPLTNYGYESEALSQESLLKPLDRLVRLEELITPTDWLNDKHKIPSKLQLSKIGLTIMNAGGHTCRIYGACVGTDAFMVLGMRIPEQEYKEISELWREVYQQFYPVIPQTLTSSQESTSQVQDEKDREQS